MYAAPSLLLAAVSGAYTRAHARRPLLTSMGLGCVIAGSGDAICQVQEGSGPLDYRRVCELGLVRGLVHAPMLYLYFPWLQRLLPGTSWPRVCGRVCLDSLVGSPVTLCVLFAATSTLKGRPQEAVERVRTQLLPTWYLGLHYWPAVHLLNFRFIPAPHQGLVAHFASVWWMIQVSAAANRRLPGAGVAVGQGEETISEPTTLAS